MKRHEFPHDLSVVYELAVNRRYIDPAVVLDLLRCLREAEDQWEWYRNFCETQGLALDSRAARIAQLEAVVRGAAWAEETTREHGTDAEHRLRAIGVALRAVLAAVKEK